MSEDKLLIKEWSKETFDMPFDRECFETDTEFHLSVDGDSVLICFYGSTSLKDWICNFRIGSIPYKDMENPFYVHTGFLKKWKSVQDEVINFVKNSKLKKVKLRGHSQGGAIALLCHEDLTFRCPEIKLDTVVFGCPKVFSKKGFKYISEKLKDSVRVINGNDFVTRVPYSFMGYRHVGRVVHIGNKYRWWLCFGLLGLDHKIAPYKKAVDEFSGEK